ncbi:MAG: beta-L-arabinofuranosidase domain-containing protein [Planctomycetota bacterium]
MRILPSALFAFVLTLASTAAAADAQPRQGLREVPSAAVNLVGGFWGPRLKIHHEVTIPHALDCLEKDGHVTNFDKAAKAESGQKPSGHPAFDSDLYKALEGALLSLQRHDDGKLRERVDGILNRILAAQQKDGFLISYFILKDQDQRWKDLRLMHPMYNAGHFFEMAVEHYRLTGDPKALDAAKRFADHIDTIFGPGKRYDVDGHQEVELALVKLYRATGEKRYLDLAKFFLDERGYVHGTEHKLFDPKTAIAPVQPEGVLTPEQRREFWHDQLRLRNGRMQDHKPVIEQHEAVGHAVRAGYMYAAMADMVRFMDAPGYEKALDDLWSDVVGRKMYVTGGIGSGQYDDEGFGDPYLLPNDSAYCESCAAIAHVLWQHRMNLLKGQAKYADVMELALYNGVLSGISLSGDQFFYQNPLTSEKGERRKKWIGLSCCPTNMARIIPQVGGLAYAVGKRQAYVNLYVAGEATLKIDEGATVKLNQQTDYPWNGRIRITVTPDQASEFTLCLRVPGWAMGRPVPSDLYHYCSVVGKKDAGETPAPQKDAGGTPTLQVNGQLADVAPQQDGYLHLQRRWQAGDVVELDLPMPVQRVHAHEKMKENQGKVALMRGPIVYCLEAVDQPAGVKLSQLRLAGDADLRAEHRPELLGGVIVVQGNALADADRPVMMTAVPYCAWANRDKLAMRVWIDEAPAKGVQAAKPSPLQAQRHPTAENGRRVVSLDGTWEISEGSMTASTNHFEHKVPVPGLVDMAQPAFAEVGVKSKLREAFWYRRTFRVEDPIPAVALLKVHKAMFGTRVILNGKPLGDHLPCFTPGIFDARSALRVGDNEILIRVGAFRESVPRPIPDGWDYEKTKFIPGIYDSVELILSGSPHIARVQAVPDIEKKSVTVHAWLRPSDSSAAVKLKFTVREAKSGQIAGEGECEIPAAGSGVERSGQVPIALRDCRLWSPESPFLYELEVRSEADVCQTRFGMRSFRLDPATGRAVLNGRPYFMRGSNFTLYRFFEDSERGDKPWREEWVRRLHKKCREMHWNSLRYCIGFPPEAWYRIADEEGFLIQDEFPIWKMKNQRGDFDGNELAQEFTEWMQERWNHPCVVIWDACNETHNGETGKAIQKVRKLDFSNRPWDNGWFQPMVPTDSWEQHPYHFIDSNFKLAYIAKDGGMLGWKPGKSPIIVNEYGWLWLNRDGTVTTLTRDLYGKLLGPNATTAQRRELYARYLAAETEFWRSHRACAGVLHFCALGYARPDGQTSDHWLDVEKLTWEPEFFKYVRDSFAPVGIMIDAWAGEYPAGKTHEFPVVIINDLYDDCRAEVSFKLLLDGKAVSEDRRPCEVPALQKQTLTFTVKLPEKAGRYQVEATLVQPGAEPVRSLRDFNITGKAKP